MLVPFPVKTTRDRFPDLCPGPSKQRSHPQVGAGTPVHAGSGRARQLGQAEHLASNWNLLQCHNGSGIPTSIDATTTTMTTTTSKPPKRTWQCPGCRWISPRCPPGTKPGLQHFMCAAWKPACNTGIAARKTAQEAESKAAASKKAAATEHQ